MYMCISNYLLGSFHSTFYGRTMNYFLRLISNDLNLSDRKSVV